ncbi:hypothetical protein PVAP13_2KG285767 [Panicum virgatum]|uniref:Uncharacterized protein n=1 Tax=Panicum virgatum TaxID=38727 RepID=A0A8T0W6P6_PANVG|nr:hypothetical protein PVAP13_2KG285767 [Panicum virgatum]
MALIKITFFLPPNIAAPSSSSSRILALGEPRLERSRDPRFVLAAGGSCAWSEARTRAARRFVLAAGGGGGGGGAAPGARWGSTPPGDSSSPSGSRAGSQAGIHAARDSSSTRRSRAGIQEGITLPGDSPSTRGALQSGVDCDSSSATGSAAKGGATPRGGLHSSGALKVLHPRQGSMFWELR